MAELLSQIQSDFNKRIKDNSKISAFYKKLEAGMATYKDACDFSAEVGNALSKAYEGNIDESILADGSLTAEVAEAIIPEPLRNNYNIISSATEQVQTSLNEKAGLGIKALVPEYDTDRVNGIIKHVTSSPYDNIKASFLNSVVNYSQSIVDKSIEKNADFQYKSGMGPIIIRTLNGSKPCKFCVQRAGTYKYPLKDREVYRRHANCTCTVEYDPSDGRHVYQDVWSKDWTTRSDDEIKDRIDKITALDKQTNNVKIEARKKAKQFLKDVKDITPFI